MINYRKKWHNIYQSRIEQVGYSPDPAQQAIIEEFARIEKAIQETPEVKKKSSGLLGRFFNKSNKSRMPAQTPSTLIPGLYLFGSVGRGKTFLMDLFCEHITSPVKRLHFHHFMKSVHDDLRTIKDTENPLEIIAETFSRHYRILCLDEFMVTDITDAMLLYGLLRGLTDRGVIIVTTTNIPPDDLYKDGLQRARFLPAIDLIKSRLVIHEIASGQDFRRLCLQRHQRFFSPLDAATQAELEQITAELSEHLYTERNGVININHRDIAFVAKSAEVIWFDFSDICEGYRSQLDYIELAKQFPVMIVANIPVLDEFHEEAAKRFLLLVDELYDKRIDLILSSAVPMDEIYTGKKILFEYDRLQSRLFEMQSADYGK